MTSDSPHHVLAALTALADPELRPQASRYLAAQGPGALPVLLAALEGDDEAVAIASAEVLAGLSDRESLASSLSALGRQALYGPPAVAVAAVTALAALPLSRATLLILEEALTGERGVVRAEAALALARLGAQGAAGLSRRAIAALAALDAADVGEVVAASLYRLEPAARAVLLPVALSVDASAAAGALRDGLARRRTAADAADTLADVDTVRALSAHLAPDTAAALAPALAVGGQALAAQEEPQPGAQEALEAATAALVETLYLVRDPLPRAPLLAALEALGARGQQILAARLADEAPARVGALAALLAEIGWRPTADRAGARYWIARGRWEDALVAGPEALGPLVEAFLASRGERREAAARALERLNWAPSEDRLRVPYLIALGRWQALAEAGGAALARIGDELAAERAAALREASPGAGEALRLRLVALLTEGSGPDAVEPLAAALEEDPSAAVRAAALRGLAGHGALDGALLVRCLQAETNRPAGARGASPALCAEMVAAIGAADGPGAVALVATLARDAEDAPTRTAAVASLAALYDREPDQVREAALALIEAGEGARLGPLLARLPAAFADALASRLGEATPGRSAQAAAALVALGQAGGEVDGTLRPALLGASAEARLAAARVYDRLEALPAGREAEAAYWLAKGRLDRCEALGPEAVPVLAAAIPLYEWRTAAAMTVALLRLHPEPEPPAVDAMVARLREVASLPAQRPQQAPPPAGAEAAARPAPLMVSHDEERRAARAYLEAIAVLRRPTSG
jgi:hypothetical protein